jgi:hypothetical protein
LLWFDACVVERGIESFVTAHDAQAAPATQGRSAALGQRAERGGAEPGARPEVDDHRAHAELTGIEQFDTESPTLFGVQFTLHDQFDAPVGDQHPQARPRVLVSLIRERHGRS